MSEAKKEALCPIHGDQYEWGSCAVCAQIISNYEASAIAGSTDAVHSSSHSETGDTARLDWLDQQLDVELLTHQSSGDYVHEISKHNQVLGEHPDLRCAIDNARGVPLTPSGETSHASSALGEAEISSTSSLTKSEEEIALNYAWAIYTHIPSVPQGSETFIKQAQKIILSALRDARAAQGGKMREVLTEEIRELSKRPHFTVGDEDQKKIHWALRRIIEISSLSETPRTEKCPACHGSGYTGTEQDHYPCIKCKATGKAPRTESGEAEAL